VLWVQTARSRIVFSDLVAAQQASLPPPAAEAHRARWQRASPGNQPLWDPCARVGWRVLPLFSGPTHRRRPGTRFAVRPPGPRCAAPVEGTCAGPLCLPCPCAVQCWGGRALGALLEPTYRLYNCRCCGVQVRICHRCDHGNLYCAGECSRIRRRESLRRAAARYQHTRRGAARHAARQRDWRASHPKVTHQGSSSGTLQCSVLGQLMTLSESTDAAGVELQPTDPHSLQGRCAFCGAALPAWTRFRLWQWSG
jgi:hypothetical protein